MLKNGGEVNDLATALLFTDGIANEGHLTTTRILRPVHKVLRQLKSQTSIFTFGYGSLHDPDMMSAVAKAGEGMYYHINTATEIPLAFADCLGGLLSVVAKNIVLGIEPAPGVVVERVYTTFPLALGNVNDLPAPSARRAAAPVQAMPDGLSPFARALAAEAVAQEEAAAAAAALISALPSSAPPAGGAAAADSAGAAAAAGPDAGGGVPEGKCASPRPPPLGAELGGAPAAAVEGKLASPRPSSDSRGGSGRLRAADDTATASKIGLFFMDKNAAEEKPAEVTPTAQSLFVTFRDLYSQEKRDTPILLRVSPAAAAAAAAPGVSEPLVRFTVRYFNTLKGGEARSFQRCSLHLYDDSVAALASAAAAEKEAGGGTVAALSKDCLEPPSNDPALAAAAAPPVVPLPRSWPRLSRERNLAVVHHKNRFLAAQVRAA